MNWFGRAKEFCLVSLDFNLPVIGVSAAGGSAVSRDAELPLWILRVVPAFSFTAVIPWPVTEAYFRSYDLKIVTNAA